MNPTKPKLFVDISEGYSNSYLIHGVIGCIFGFVLFFVHPLLTIPTFAISLMLFLSKTGLLINNTTGTYKKYVSFASYKTGVWKSFPKIYEVHLVLFIEKTRNEGYYNAQTVKSYNIELLGRISNEPFYEFMEYKQARSALLAISACLQIPARDFVAEKIAENRQRRAK